MKCCPMTNPVCLKYTTKTMATKKMKFGRFWVKKTLKQKTATSVVARLSRALVDRRGIPVQCNPTRYEVCIINTSCQKLSFGSGDDPDKLFISPSTELSF